MGYYGHLELKQKAQELRRQGKSYMEIVQTLQIPKSTVSCWCKDIPLTKRQVKRLYVNKKTGALRGSYIAAQNKKNARQQQRKNLYKMGIKQVGKMSKRDRFITGIALYAAEGTKTDKGCAFSNSDPSIIEFMVRWFRDFLAVPNEKFHAAIWLHEKRSEKQAIKYWSCLTHIQPINFYKTYIAENKINSRKIRKHIHEYGVFTFYVSDVVLIRRMMGFIGGILDRPMV